MVTSQNGYVADQIELTKVYRIAGTTLDIRFKRGSAGEMLADFLAKFNKAVEPLDGGQRDDWGYAERKIRGSQTTVSNHASGTAADVNATKHPLGKRGTFSGVQVANIHALLEQYDGCIRWGGDYHNRVDEMHFEIVRPLADVTTTMMKIRARENEMDLRPEDLEKIASAVVDHLLNAVVDSTTVEGGKRKVGGMLTSIERLAAESAKNSRS